LKCVEGLATNVAISRSGENGLVFKGDSLEVLGEIFFKVFGADPRVGLVAYSPISIDEDYGVDAVRTNVLGVKCAVQYKYKSNANDLVGWVDLAKTEAYGRRHLECETDQPSSVWIVTTSRDGVTPTCAKILGKSLRVISKGVLEDMIDNNETFWDRAWNMVKNYSMKN
jgi:hypothetical protein